MLHLRRRRAILRACCHEIVASKLLFGAILHFFLLSFYCTQAMTQEVSKPFEKDYGEGDIVLVASDDKRIECHKGSL